MINGELEKAPGLDPSCMRWAAPHICFKYALVPLDDDPSDLPVTSDAHALPDDGVRDPAATGDGAVAASVDSGAAASDGPRTPKLLAGWFEVHMPYAHAVCTSAHEFFTCHVGRRG